MMPGSERVQLAGGGQTQEARSIVMRVVMLEVIFVPSHSACKRKKVGKYVDPSAIRELDLT